MGILTNLLLNAATGKKRSAVKLGWHLGTVMAEKSGLNDAARAAANKLSPPPPKRGQPKPSATSRPSPGSDAEFQSFIKTILGWADHNREQFFDYYIQMLRAFDRMPAGETPERIATARRNAIHDPTSMLREYVSMLQWIHDTQPAAWRQILIEHPR